MPEFYVESMKDRRTCFKCQLTVTGKKASLFTCNKCHAITYCGEECQRDDWNRHEWNCVPVMVKEFPGKGRGIVAARDIKLGEIIFTDKPVITLAMNAQGMPVDPEFMTSLREQIEILPKEAKLQFYKLKPGIQDNSFLVSNNNVESLNLFLNNSIHRLRKDENSTTALLYLNMALVNHSCVPNAAFSRACRPTERVDDQDLNNELIAIKDISKGDEITVCYIPDMKKHGSILRKRKTAFKKELLFDCKCPVCSGEVSCQEKLLKKLIELHNKLDPTPTDWKRETGIRNKIVDLTMGLLIGDQVEKSRALLELAQSAHLARDRKLVRKAMDMFKQLVEDTKLKNMQWCYEILEKRFSHWSKEFSSGIPPEKREIAFITRLVNLEIEAVIPEVD